MAGPTVAWTDFDIADLITGPQSAALFTLLRNNQEHLYEVAHTGGYGGSTAHTHASSGAASVDLTVHENLLLCSCPGPNYAQSPMTGSKAPWILSGMQALAYYHDNTGALIGGTINDTAYQLMGGDSTGESKAFFGANGCDCVVSFFIKPIAEDMAAGAMTFGFADNSTSAWTDSASFTFANINNGWTRVYARFTGAGGGHATDVRMLLKVTTAFSFGFLLTGLQVNRGRHLAPWTISNVEGKTAANGNVNYTDMPDCPVLDQRIAMDDAVDVT